MGLEIGRLPRKSGGLAALIYFDILNLVGVADECDRQMDGWMDGQTEPPLAVARSNKARKNWF